MTSPPRSGAKVRPPWCGGPTARTGRNEVICHLRDIEEVYFVRFHTMLSNDDPKIYADPSARRGALVRVLAFG